MLLTDEKRNERIKEIVSDEEFLKKLTELARLSGWQNDYVEIRQFMEDCYHAAGKPVPELEPFEITYNQEE